jgi:multiple sugar transport system substrate-binding protein
MKVYYNGNAVQEIELSTMSFSGPLEGELRDLLRDFEARHNARVNLHLLEWETSWSELLRYTFAGHGPAVSEVGDTWLASLALMNALRPFSAREVAAFGGQASFLPAATRSSSLPNDPTVWSMPWLAETRAIYYRRDLLVAAGVDESTAFATQANLEQTLQRLQESGVAMPWVVPSEPGVDTLHNLNSWIWGAGGDYVDPAHRRVTIAEEPARAGLRAYFGLHRFLAAEAHHLSIAQTDALFAAERAAATISGPWLATPAFGAAEPARLERVGVALPPGVPTVLGSHLVIWKHTPYRQEKLALELIAFLTGQQAQSLASQQVGMLPVRLDALAGPPFAEDPIYRTFVAGLRAGRSFPVMRLWATVEEHLTAALGRLWASVLANPDADLDSLIRAELEPLTQRLNRTLQ